MGSAPARHDLVLVAVAVLVAVVAGSLWLVRRPEPPPTFEEADVSVSTVAAPRLAASSGEGTVTVHVAGAVARPGLVVLPGGSRVADAVVAAGGALPAADLGAINLAAPLRDGDRIEVPLPGAASGSTAGSGPGGVDLNRATAAELEALPGVGPVLAARIVAWREEHGPFTAVEDLLDVPGIGEAKLAELRGAVAAP